MHELELVLVCENTASRGDIIGEHGLSWLIRTQNKSLLFDAGQGLGLDHNCCELGIDLSKLDAVLLSHGHYDHVKGLSAVLQQNDHCPIYEHSAAQAQKFSRTPTGTCKCLSIPLLTEDAATKPWRHRLRFADKPTEVIPSVFATGYVPRVTSFEDVGGPFFLDPTLSQPDPLDDDLSLFFNTPEGTCVVLGCAHAGVINILKHIQTLTRNKPIAAVYGGMHLLVATEDRLNQTVTELRSLGSPRLYPNHCTGVSAIHHLYNAFPGKVFPASAGMKWRFELAE